jgi:hypothetical protein
MVGLALSLSSMAAGGGASIDQTRNVVCGVDVEGQVWMQWRLVGAVVVVRN